MSKKLMPFKSAFGSKKARKWKEICQLCIMAFVGVVLCFLWC
jgi:hypothetical protein